MPWPTAGQVIPPLVAGEPLHHYQRAATLTGTLRLDQHEIEFTGTGFRDRTWGYRDESANISEYVAVLVAFESYALTSMTFRDTTGAQRTEGFVLGENAERISEMGITRDASGLFAAADLIRTDAPELTIRNTARRGGFWVPMGWERKGPAFSAYDEFMSLRDHNGEIGAGIVEQGVLRQVF